MASAKDIIIDLTSSFYFYHNSLSDATIVIDSDDSFDCSSESKKKKKDLDSGKKNKLIKEKTVSPITKKSNDSERTLNIFGECAICWEEIGKNPLASTKCGHVFCIACLKKSLKVLNRCPTCRCSLKGKSAYHPLYLSKQE